VKIRAVSAFSRGNPRGKLFTARTNNSLPRQELRPSPRGIAVNPETNFFLAFSMPAVFYKIYRGAARLGNNSCGYKELFLRAVSAR